MNPIANGLGHIIGLGLIPAALIWVLRGTRPGRVVWDTCARARAARRARLDREHQQRLEDAYRVWQAERDWWAWYRDQHAPGTPQYELAHTFIGNMAIRRPQCPHTGLTCAIPDCPNHPWRHKP